MSKRLLLDNLISLAHTAADASHIGRTKCFHKTFQAERKLNARAAAAQTFPSVNADPDRPFICSMRIHEDRCLCGYKVIAQAREAIFSANGSRRGDANQAFRLRDRWNSTELFQLRNFDLQTCDVADVERHRRQADRITAANPHRARAIALLRLGLLWISYSDRASVSTRDGSSLIITPTPEPTHHLHTIFHDGTFYPTSHHIVDEHRAINETDDDDVPF